VRVKGERIIDIQPGAAQEGASAAVHEAGPDASEGDERG
jgi:hypothetical protein